jgi:hypothetical protein
MTTSAARRVAAVLIALLIVVCYALVITRGQIFTWALP